MSTHTTFSFERGNLRKLLSIPAYVLGFLLAWIIPRRRNTWAFGSGIGVGEGALAVAIELTRSDPSATITWIASDEAEQALATEHGFNSVLKSSFAGFWATLKAQFLVVTHGLGDVQRFGVFRASVLNLWHGAPIKKLHLDTKVTTGLNAGGIFSRILTTMYLRGAGEVDVYAAGSFTAAERLRTAFRVVPGKVQILGDPRLDGLIGRLQRPDASAKRRHELSETLELTKTQRARRWVLYAPTWRDGGENAGIPNADETAALHAWADATNVTLFIRSHHLGQGDYSHVFSEQVIALPSTIVRDITPDLAVFDAVITDYSSIAIDFSLTGRPIIWFAPDLDEYSANRGLYEPYEVTTEGHIAVTWAEAIARAGRALDRDKGAHRAALIRSQRLATRFHTYQDGGSAKRVLEYARVLAEPSKRIQREHSVFFESFYGTNATCNPYALDQELTKRYPELVRYWSVASENIHVPAGAIALLVGSPEWHAARRLVRLLIVNDWLRFDFKRRRHQYVLQTWHGTPLKRIALDRSQRSLRTSLAIRRESRRWSALLTQNPHASTALQRSYRFTGELRETGYPRNDRLANSAHEGERILSAQSSARHRLGLPLATNVVLYAPTWRDTGATTVDTLNVALLAEQLGETWTILARGHSRDGDVAHYTGSRVIDVTQLPDVNDLILASDVFITDYSSLMFDVSVACVPMVLFMPDLDEYRDTQRGFTFDITAEAPGPILTRTEEVAEHLTEFAQAGSGSSWCTQHSEAADRWRHRYNPHDDGQSAVRVIDWLSESGRIPLARA